MRRGTSFLAFAAVTALCVCALAMAVWLPLRASLRFRTEDTRVSLETSRQRETKQTYEYDQVVEALPLAQAELDELQPRADAAVALDQALRAERKQLRAEVKALQAELDELKAAQEPAEVQP